MTEAEAVHQLETEGYRNVSAWFDSPDFSYSEHVHDYVTAHIILDGQMLVMMEGMVHDLQPDDRIDIPAQQSHAATMGPDGCFYVSGEK